MNLKIKNLFNGTVEQITNIEVYVERIPKIHQTSSEIFFCNSRKYSINK